MHKGYLKQSLIIYFYATYLQDKNTLLVKHYRNRTGGTINHKTALKIIFKRDPSEQSSH